MGGVAKLNRPKEFGRNWTKIYIKNLPQPKVMTKLSEKWPPHKKFRLALKERGLRRNKDEEGAKNTMGDK